MKFRKYRKVTLIRARVMTKSGTIKTLEGLERFHAGDYLARDSKGEWPITSEDMRKYYRRVSEPDKNGFAEFQSLDVREAYQMDRPFTTGAIAGKAGDYLVRGQGIEWPVDRELFECTYKAV